MAATNDKILRLLKTLPHQPGVYRFIDEGGRMIYVGKAKDLKKRVFSYFNKESGLSGKVQVMVKRVADISCVVTDTETDALLLENNLIKTHQPKYNINLKDDKTYPWICIRNEPFPRIFVTRNPEKDGSSYYGPYSSGRMMHTILDLIRQLFPRRTCNLKLTPQNIESQKFKVCLQYHIGNCKAPCTGLQSEADYLQDIASMREIIRGNLSLVAQRMKKEMMDYAAALEFEKAQIVKEKLEILRKYQSKSAVVSSSVAHADVFAIISDDRAGYVNYMKVVDGSVVQSHSVEIRKKLEETDVELLLYAITEFRLRFESDAPEIIVAEELSQKVPGAGVVVPKRGDRRQLLDLSMQNARYFRGEMRKQAELVDPERHSRRILQQMMGDLRMTEPPAHIECFDNSNLQGTQPVAAMVVFKNARPARNEYRHYNIRTVSGPDDFASMEEVVYRRYKRLLDEEKPLPQLIVVDGGKGQLSSALYSLERLGLRGQITIVGIAKRLEEIYYPGDSLPLYLDKKSETLRVLQHIRDEAHRFGISHHRQKREKQLIQTELTQAPGIGAGLASRLLNTFRSVEDIRLRTEQEIADVIGPARAKALLRYLNSLSQS